MKFGQGTDQADAIRGGFRQIPVVVLLARIVGNTVYGDYLNGFRHVSIISDDGNIEGTNNAGSYNTGRWKVDEVENTFSVEWDQSWVPTTTCAFSIGEEIHFFDDDTGAWRMSFTTIIPGKQPLEIR